MAFILLIDDAGDCLFGCPCAMALWYWNRLYQNTFILPGSIVFHARHQLLVLSSPSTRPGNTLVCSLCATHKQELGIWENFFSEGVVGHWNRLPGSRADSTFSGVEWTPSQVESPFLEVLKKCVDVAVRDMVSAHSGDGLTVGLNLSGLFQLQWFYDSRKRKHDVSAQNN